MNIQITLIHILVKARMGRDNNISFKSRLWIFGLIVMFIFASVHQTWVYLLLPLRIRLLIPASVTIMMWSIFELAQRPDCQDVLRKEVQSQASCDRSPGHNSTLDLQGLRKLVYTDSFIREVLRMKGDAVNVVRMARRDVQINGYTLPKGEFSDRLAA